MKGSVQTEQQYLVDEDSDEYGAISSEEEQDVDEGGMNLVSDQESDEFEKEMDMEIRQSMAIKIPVGSEILGSLYNLEVGTHNIR